MVRRMVRAVCGAAALTVPLLLACPVRSRDVAPTSGRKAPMKLTGITSETPTPRRFQKMEWTVELPATYDNPFDSSAVALDARITPPSGRNLTVPAFFYRPYARALNDGKEELTPAGNALWKIRFTPPEEGQYRMVVQLTDRNGAAQSDELRFRVAGSQEPGFIRLSERDRRYFDFESGKPYFPVGANVCWAGGRGTFDYDEWFAAYGRSGCSFARLWLSPNWATLALERPGKASEGLGMGRFDLANAWRLDRVIETAGEHGLYLMLCIDSYNILREKTAYPEWERTPHNAANGGPLARPTDFWTDARMETLYRDKLRYLVARYGYSPHVFAWEFWNEVDVTTGYRTAPVRDWHARMARFLRELDPYDHLITTSFSRSDGDPEIDRLPELDFVQTHHYGSPDLAATLAAEQARKAAYGKPHIVGEIGADAGGPRRADDPQGLQVHDPLWVTIATASSGAAAPWWWDNLIAPENLYGLFTPAARFAAGIDWPAEEMKPLRPRVEWRTRPDRLPRGDVVLQGGPVSWDVTEYNRPRTVRVSRSGLESDLPVAGIQHGLKNHPDMHNPVTFETDLPWPARLEVEVGDVSGYGGAALRIRLDGKVVLERDFSDTDADTKTITRYTGAYGIDVPAGKHRVEVENHGNDWFMAGFRLRNAVERTGPPLLAWASAGRRTAVGWVRLEDRTWRRVCALKQPVPPAPASVLVLPGVGAGNWQAEVWDTWSGQVVGSEAIVVPGSGEARVSLPAIEKDLAVRLRRKE